MYRDENRWKCGWCIYSDKAREEEKGWVYGTADGPGAPFSERIRLQIHFRFRLH
jgi:hypothetical protein